MDLATQRLKLKDIFPTDYKEIVNECGVDEDSEEIEYLRKGLEPRDLEFTDGEHAVITYISTLSVDADNEVVMPSGGNFERYRKHPVVLLGHGYRGQQTGGLGIGKNLWIKRDAKGLIAKTLYANTEEADKIYFYRKDGFPLAESIGFMPLESVSRHNEDKWKRTLGLWKREYRRAFGDFPNDEVAEKLNRIYTKWLLLEYSDVLVPSNPDALEIAVSKGLEHADGGYKIITQEDELINFDEIEWEDKNELIEKPEAPPEGDYIHIPAPGEEGKHSGHRIRTINISTSEGIKAKYCGQCKKVISYMFDKKKWTMERARAWVREHAKAITYDEEIDGLVVYCTKRDTVDMSDIPSYTSPTITFAEEDEIEDDNLVELEDTDELIELTDESDDTNKEPVFEITDEQLAKIIESVCSSFLDKFKESRDNADKLSEETVERVIKKLKGKIN